MAYAAAEVPIPPARPFDSSPTVAAEAKPAPVPQRQRPVAAAAVPRVLRPLFGGDPVEPPNPAARIAMAHSVAATASPAMPAGELAPLALALPLPGEANTPAP
jgi:hypothetical protein